MRRLLVIIVAALVWHGAALAQTATQDALSAFDALRRGEWQLAQFFATRAIEAGTLPQPDQGAVHGYRGDARRHLEDYEGALADYGRALALGVPRQFAARVHNGRGLLLFEIGRHDLALEDYATALRLDPTFVEAHVNRGTVYLLNRQLDRAFTDFNAAIRMAPDNARAYTNRGQAYLELEFWEEAVGDFTVAMELAPTLEEAVVPLFNRGLAWEGLGEADEALADFALAYELAPDEPTYWDKFAAYGLMQR